MIGRQRKQQTELLTECQGCNVVQYVYLHARKTQNATDDRRPTKEERGERGEGETFLREHVFMKMGFS